MKTNELRKLSIVDLAKKLTEAKGNLMKHRVQVAAGSATNPGLIKKVRKDIARILTLINEKE